MNELPGAGLYAITPQWYPDHDRLLEAVQAALEGGAVMVQFRDKSGDADWRRGTAAGMKAVCENYRAPLVINDDVGLALAIGAAGVHLGLDDTGPEAARQALGPGVLIGVSCYNQPSRAAAAAGAGADYLAFGSMYPSPTKSSAVQCSTRVLERAAGLRLPLVAIGGITPGNGARLIRAGADYLAVISGVFEQPDVTAAARRFAALWNRREPGRR